MKKILNIALALACVVALAFAFTACSSGTACVSHSDIDKNGYCDMCMTPYSCPGHKDANSDKMCDFCLAEYSHSGHYDDNGDLKCDVCGAPYMCEHEDTDGDEFCDNCLCEFVCPAPSDSNGDGFCDMCKAPYTCVGHIDANGDKVCDNCKCFYTCAGHRDSDSNGRCDACKAPFTCDGHIDPGVDGRCDKCYGAFVCPGHTDGDNNGKCDICQTKYEVLGDFRGAFAAASKATDPEGMVITVTTNYEGIATLVSTYTVTFNADGSSVIVAEIQKLNETLEGDLVVTLPTVTITCENGVYSDGYEFEYEYLSTEKPAIDFMKIKSGTFRTATSTILEATIAAADTESVIGVAYPYNVNLTANKNDTEITSISISYSNVVISCVYN